MYLKSIDYARQSDQEDDLRSYREMFHLPTHPKTGEQIIYFCGNSLGLQPKSTKEEINQILQSWEHRGVEGHFHGDPSWIDYNTPLKEKMAAIVGGHKDEVAIMNTLSVNLHLLMASFYRPTKERFKILIESDAFPSDKYVAASQARWHGLDPAGAVIELKPSPGETLLELKNIEEVLASEGDQIAVVMLGGVNFYTGQALDMKKITALCHEKGCIVGFDLAHAAGNIPLQLHEWNVDFAAWCNYKYLNSGPGAIASVFIHGKHHNNNTPRLEAWWGNNIKSRFEMADSFDPAIGAEAWVMSTPPTIAIAAIKAALDIHTAAGMNSLRSKSLKLTGYLEFLVEHIENKNIEIISPKNAEDRGCQLSIRVHGADKRIFDAIHDRGVELDWREPDVIRVSPTPLYNTYIEVFRFVEILKEVLNDN